jgi:antitoxin ParD1/3/4
MIMARTITVDTGEELKSFIDDSIKSGSYKTTSEIVREGLRLLQEKQANSKLATLRRIIKEGEDSGISQYSNFDDFIKKMDAQTNEPPS